MSKNKYKWILFLVVVLMISNIVLAVLLFTPPGEKEIVRKKKENPSMAIYKEIGLDSIQIDTFKARKELYFKHIRPVWEEIRDLKDSLYRNMEVSPNDSSVQQLITLIAEKSKDADLKMYQHFYEMRQFCNPDQQVRYDTIVPKLITRTGRGNRR